MMNRSQHYNHNICGSSSSGFHTAEEVHYVRERRAEAGYTLVALLALMTVLALFAMAAAPSIQQQAQREREKEAIFRGEQVVDAIRAYYLNRAGTTGVQGDQALPSSMDQLLEGIPVRGGAKKRQILRASAARDPLSADGEWRLIHPRSQVLMDFQQSVLIYAGNVVPSPANQQILQLQRFAAPQLVGVLNTGSTQKSSSTSLALDDSSGPFVGVSPRNSNPSILTYYGIEQLDEWIFTPLFRP